VVFLIDESAAMAAVPGDLAADGTKSAKSNGERVATAINSLLNQLTRGPDFDVALIGYRSDHQGTVDVGSRWGGTLAGREFVPLGDLAAAPVRVENRARKIPAADGSGMREETVAFPVWYVPTLGAKAPQIAAYQYCAELLSRWASCAGANSPAPLVVHIFGGTSGDGNPQMAVAKLLNLRLPAEAPLVFQAHLASNAAALAAEYPSSQVYLTMGSSRDIFRRASALPAELAAALKKNRVAVNQGARAMLYNAKMTDVVRMLSLVATHTKAWPSRAPAASPVATPAVAAAPAIPVAAPAIPVAAPLADVSLAAAVPPAAVEAAGIPAVAIEAEPLAAVSAAPVEAAAEAVEPPPLPAPAAEKLGLIVMLLDRSVADPFSGNVHNVCAKLQGHANDLLKQIAGPKTGPVDVAIVSYGANAAGEPEIRSTFDGPLAGRAVVRNSELADGALRVDEVDEESVNALGVLTANKRKNLIFFDVEPTLPAPPRDAFAAVADIVTNWRAEHPATCLPPIVLHLTRGQQSCDELMESMGPIRAAGEPGGPITLYHLVATEQPCRSMAYPDGAASIGDPILQAIWEMSSPLLGSKRLAAEKPAVKPDSRGFVVNGKFDLLLDEVRTVLNG
jgi:hypothetical protein